MKKTVYIIGGGFISSHLITILKKHKYSVTLLHHTDKIDIKEADYIFYLASYGNHFNQKDLIKTIKANILDYYTLLKGTEKVQYKGLFYFSTSSVTLQVQTAYSDTKFIGELLGKRYFRKYNKPIVSIRPYSIYGEGEADFRFIPTVIQCLKNDTTMPLAEGFHDWTYVDDFCEAVVKLMENVQKVVGKSVAIGTGKQYPNSEVVQILEELSGKKLKVKSMEKRPYDTRNWVADTTVIKSLGFKPKHTLYQGLKNVWMHSKKD